MLEHHDVVETLLVLLFSLGEGALEDLDLFVQECELVVPSDELCAKDVPLVNDVLVVLL